MIEIPLTKGYVAIVDDEDADLAKMRWFPSFSRHGRKPAAYRRPIGFMHRVILSRVIGRQLTKGEVVDHINGCPTDNRRSNLRIANQSQNMGNTGKYSTNTSGYKGVSPFRGKWRAMIHINDKTVHIGVYNTPEEASNAYMEAAKKHFGEFARAA